MVQFSRSWVEAFRGIDDLDDLRIREVKGKRADDFEWWDVHEKEIYFFFSTLEELNLGYFKDTVNQDDLVFHMRKSFKRFLLRKWQPVVLYI